MPHQLPLLPLDFDIESKPVLKKAAAARAALAEVKGVATTIPNETILINTLSLQEAKDSSAIENIVTTNDELFQSDALTLDFRSPAAKEVYSYAQALKDGFQIVKEKGFLSLNHIKKIQSIIAESDAGFRKLPGTVLKNDRTGEVVYTPPQHPEEVETLMGNFEAFFNGVTPSDWDPLIKMAVLHHQFESIHPFYDGNGRTGRILNLLYLVKEGLLDTPVLYLSRYINQHKAEYYQLLQKVRDENAWEQWVLFMLEAVEHTSLHTTKIILGIKELMQHHKQHIRKELPKIYSQDLVNVMFRHPYTKIEFVVKELQVSRVTAARYLDELSIAGILDKVRLGRDNYYINVQLYELLANVNSI